MVEIIHYETANKNKIIGYADIRVPISKPTVLIFRKIAHLQSGDRSWFNLPAFLREAQNRSQFYYKYCEFEAQDITRSLLESLGDKVKAYCKEHGIFPQKAEEVPMILESNDELPF